MTLGAWLLVGFFAGWLASLITSRGDGRGGCCAYIVTGMVGSFVGGGVMALLTGRDYQEFITGFNLETVLVAVLGAVLLTAVFRLISGYGWNRRRPY